MTIPEAYNEMMGAARRVDELTNRHSADAVDPAALKLAKFEWRVALHVWRSLKYPARTSEQGVGK